MFYNDMKKVENTQKLPHQQKGNDEHCIPLSVTYSQTCTQSERY